ncbi:hypothetical protein [Desulfosarcina sp. BuS5]|uniref:hypothetical protein n=1 Tax=Desulfosarcina sp. BuS5 TaxID=933262 RepID=UPI002379D267|nr:hypothetical protein [Desulfosarcina sp. BuS5]
MARGGISRSSFSEIINSRGLEQLEYVFQALCSQAQNALPSNYSDLGVLSASVHSAKKNLA